MSNTTVQLISADAADEDLIRQLLASIKEQPFKQRVATSMPQALDQLHAEPPQVIVLALNLPEPRGLSAFLRLQPKAGELPVIVLVDATEAAMGSQAVARGALDCLVRQQLTAVGLSQALRNATEQTHTLRALKASQVRYRELYENVVAGVFQTTPEGHFIAANPALVRLLGYRSEDDLLNIQLERDLYVHPHERARWLAGMTRDGEVRNAELTLRRGDGQHIVVLENSRAVCDEQGKALYYEGTLTDITEAHELSRQLSYEATHDALSGLINRREFEARLQRALDEVLTGGVRHAVCYLDLDQFKIINDTCGHMAGDELLRQLAQVLQRRIRGKDTLARLGGDEFGLLLRDCDLPSALEVANDLLRAIEQYSFIWGSNTFSVGVSIGLVPLTNEFRSLAQVLKAADAACYAAKDQGRHRVHVYQEDDSLLAQRQGQMQWVTRVKRALSEDRFFLDAQQLVPVRVGTDQPRHYELLVRMRDESGRVVAPGAFLPAVERFNLSRQLDRWVIATALRWLADHPNRPGKGSRVFINLSGDSLGDEQLQGFIEQQISQTGVDPHRLGFEITETAAIGNLPRADRLITRLHELGCCFSLDDFGSGVSSFAYLKALSVAYLKIDGLFTGRLVEDRIDYEMVRSITDIGHVMGKQVVAESVESEQALQKLREIGVDYAQGYAVGSPRPLEEL